MCLPGALGCVAALLWMAGTPCANQACHFLAHLLTPSLLHCSVMLWRRSDNVVFALLLGGAGLVAVGDGVECRVKGILQVCGACLCMGWGSFGSAMPAGLLVAGNKASRAFCR